jgi:hypothetical protein
VGNNRGEVRDCSITHGGNDCRYDVDVADGSETIEITTVRFERSQVLELFRAIARPLDSTVIPWRRWEPGTRHRKYRADFGCGGRI